MKADPKRTSTAATDPWCDRDEIIRIARDLKLRQTTDPDPEIARYLTWLVEKDSELHEYVREDPLFFDEWTAARRVTIIVDDPDVSGEERIKKAIRLHGGKER